MDSRSATRQITDYFPEIRVKLAKQIRTGWENLVLEVNREWIFRFPKSSEAERRFKREVRVLSRLAELVSTPVPSYRYVFRGSRKHPHWFGGYRKLQGRPISDPNLTDKSKRNLARQISVFLRELHAVKTETIATKLPTHSRTSWLRSVRRQPDRIRSAVYPLIDSKLRIRSELLWKSLLADFEHARFKPTLIHGDLGAENILYCPNTGTLSGILDWGYVQVSDPALEFAHLFIHDPDLGREILDHYGRQGADFDRRVQWYVRTEPYYDIMWGVSQNWEKARKLGMRNLKIMLGEL